MKVFKYDGHEWIGPTVLNEHFCQQTFSMDGKTLYLSGEKENQVWVSRRTEDGWTAPALFLEEPYGMYDLMPTQSGTYYLAGDAHDSDKKNGITSSFSTLALAGNGSTIKSLGRPLSETGFNFGGEDNRASLIPTSNSRSESDLARIASAGILARHPGAR
jgi:hypothetical protein